MENYPAKKTDNAQLPDNLEAVTGYYETPDDAYSHLKIFIDTLQNRIDQTFIDEWKLLANFLNRLAQEEEKMYCKRVKHGTAHSIKILELHLQELVEIFDNRLEELRTEPSPVQYAVPRGQEEITPVKVMKESMRQIRETSPPAFENIGEPTPQELAEEEILLAEDLAALEAELGIER